MEYADLFILNVGNGSCAVIDHTPSGRLSMVDVNNAKELPEDERQVLAEAEEQTYEAALEDPISWVRTNLPGRALFRFVLSHPDADHMEGLHRMLANKELRLLNFWDLPHQKEAPEKFRTTGQQLDWEVYQDFRANPELSAYDPKLIEPLQLETGDYWTDDELQILSPSRELIDDCEVGAYDSNNMSRVMRFAFAGRSVLLPGDVEAKGWTELADAAGSMLDIDVLIASHHGRRSGYPPDDVMETLDPEVVIVSASKLPKEHDAVPWYAAKSQVISTRIDGSLVIRVWDDGELALFRLSDAQKLHWLAPLV